MTELTSKNVNKIFFDSLVKDKKDFNDETMVEYEGIATKALFNKQSLKNHYDEITEMLEQLPKEFMSTDKGGGGGYSFLKACDNKDGLQWTGEHYIMEQLFLLGLSVDKVKVLLPRQLWPALPGGVPYYVVL